MPTNSHIAILCSRLDLPGGIEKAIAQLSNLLHSKNLTVSLVVLDKTAHSFFPVNKEINCINLRLFFGITEKGNIVSRKITFFRDVLQLRKLLKKLKPGLIIATEYPFAVACALTSIQKKAKLISWEHHHFYELKKSFFWEKLTHYTYPKLDAVICLNEDEKNLFSRLNKAVYVIPNYIVPAASPPIQKSKTILTVGRLTYVKGTDLLLQAAKIVFQKNKDWRWKLIGDGDMKEDVIAFIRKENLESNLFIQSPSGYDLSDEYGAASIYACTSRNESFGMTIAEAMNAGLPVVSFDCDTGPRHLIEHEKNGLLAEKENPAAFADMIIQLMDNESKRNEMGRYAVTTMQRLSPENIFPLWNNLFTDLAF